jgi:hypothetical protein
MYKCDLIFPCLEAVILLETLSIQVDEWDGLQDEGEGIYVEAKPFYVRGTSYEYSPPT